MLVIWIFQVQLDPTVLFPATSSDFVAVRSGNSACRKPALRTKLPPVISPATGWPIVPVRESVPPLLVSPPDAITDCGISSPLDSGAAFAPVLPTSCLGRAVCAVFMVDAGAFATDRLPLNW